MKRWFGASLPQFLPLFVLMFLLLGGHAAAQEGFHVTVEAGVPIAAYGQRVDVTFLVTQGDEDVDLEEYGVSCKYWVLRDGQAGSPKVMYPDVQGSRVLCAVGGINRATYQGDGNQLRMEIAIEKDGETLVTASHVVQLYDATKVPAAPLRVDAQVGDVISLLELAPNTGLDGQRFEPIASLALDGPQVAALPGLRVVANQAGRAQARLLVPGMGESPFMTLDIHIEERDEPLPIALEDMLYLDGASGGAWYTVGHYDRELTLAQIEGWAQGATLLDVTAANGDILARLSSSRAASGQLGLTARLDGKTVCLGVVDLVAEDDLTSQGIPDTVLTPSAAALGGQAQLVVSGVQGDWLTGTRFQEVISVRASAPDVQVHCSRSVVGGDLVYQFQVDAQEDTRLEVTHLIKDPWGYHEQRRQTASLWFTGDGSYPQDAARQIFANADHVTLSAGQFVDLDQLFTAQPGGKGLITQWAGSGLQLTQGRLHATGQGGGTLSAWAEQGAAQVTVDAQLKGGVRLSLTDGPAYLVTGQQDQFTYAVAWPHAVDRVEAVAVRGAAVDQAALEDGLRLTLTGGEGPAAHVQVTLYWTQDGVRVGQCLDIQMPLLDQPPQPPQPPSGPWFDQVDRAMASALVAGQAYDVVLSPVGAATGSLSDYALALSSWGDACIQFGPVSVLAGDEPGFAFQATYQAPLGQDAGGMAATITHLGEMVGHWTWSDRVLAGALQDAQVTAQSAVYSGQPIAPQVQVQLNGYTLAQGQDYALAPGPDMVNAGSYPLFVDGLSGYEGQAQGSFVIAPLDLFSDGIVVETLSDQIYTGQPLCPAPRVFHGDKLLAPGEDYEVGYRNNVEIGDRSAAARIKGKGNYTGSVEATFGILKGRGPAPLGLQALPPTVWGKPDGAIMGVTDQMEYRGEGETAYRQVPQGAKQVEGLAAGRYWVRYAQTATADPGLDAEVVVPQGTGRLAVTYVAYAGHVQVVSDLAYGQQLTPPQLPPRPGYSFVGWYIGDAAWDFGAAITQSMTLTARWAADEVPGEPGDPGVPVDPVGPVIPVDPVDPVEPVDPVGPEDPDDPVDPAEPLPAVIATLSIAKGKSMALPTFTGAAVRWELGQGDAVKLADGRIKAVKEGEATLILWVDWAKGKKVATLDGHALKGNRRYTVTVQVRKAGQLATKVRVSARSVALDLNGHGQVALTAQAVPEGKVLDGEIFWVSADPNIATVDADGVVRAVAPGATQVYAYSTNLKKATVAVKVRGLVTKLQFVDGQGAPIKKTALALGQQAALTVVANEDAINPKVAFASSKPKVVSVDEEGTVVALKKGKAVITCRATDGSGKKATLTVTVK